MASQIEEIEERSNILWISQNTDSLLGFKRIYNRLKFLENAPEVEWVLLNICCYGSEDSDYSFAVLNLLRQCSKPIKTQVITHAHSFGLIFACIGEERVAWPDASFMHHSFHVSLQETSLEELNTTLNHLKKFEKKCTTFLKEQIGAPGFTKLMKEFKKHGAQDLYFEAQDAVMYNIVDSIGSLEPVFF